jgi:UDP-N-acetylbacillosamine N-acetyltransferase
MSNKLFIIGCGGHARSVADVYLLNHPGSEIVFVDDNAQDQETIWGFSVIKSLPDDAESIHVALGANLKRKTYPLNIVPVTIISNSAHVSQYAEIGEGCFIAHKSYIGPSAKIGRGTIINTAAVVEHEVEIGDYTHVAPNATICGRSKLGNLVFMGAGAVVKESIEICSNTCIGAGSVVIRSICSSGVYVGVPASQKKQAIVG